jgi:hypothetical protein
LLHYRNILAGGIGVSPVEVYSPVSVKVYYEETNTPIAL